MSFVKRIVRSYFRRSLRNRLRSVDKPVNYAYTHRYPQTTTVRETSKSSSTSYTPEEMRREFDILDRGVGRKRWAKTNS